MRKHNVDYVSFIATPEKCTDGKSGKQYSNKKVSDEKEIFH